MTDYTILDDIESMCDVVRVKNITIDFIKQYIINTEKCETLCTFLRNHHDNLDVKYKMHGLNETYNQIRAFRGIANVIKRCARSCEY